MKASWGYVEAAEIKDFVNSCRPVQPWKALEDLRVVMVLSIIMCDDDVGSGRATTSTDHRLTITGPLGGDGFTCNRDGYLPLRKATVDCLLVFWRGETHRDLGQYSVFLQRLGDVLKPTGIAFIMHAGSLEVEVVVKVQEALLPASLVVTTARSVTPDKLFFCGPRVKEASKQVLGSVPPARGRFVLLQIQPTNSPPRPSQVTENALQVVDRSIKYDILPAFQGPFMSAEDQDLFYPLPPEASHPHLANFYEWQDLFPQLRVLQESLPAILEEALQVSGWFAWPEYHFREGASSNDWRVVPFVHTFPATDPSKTQWLSRTCTNCPKITAALRKIPGLRTALLSRLGPCTRLSAHTGWDDLANHVLRVHFSLKVPADRTCGLWVEGEVRYHQEGDFIVFDDSKIHKAFNIHPTESRIVLILDMARPETISSGVAVGGHTPELDDLINLFR